MLKPDRFRSSRQIAISQTTPVQRVGIGIRESLRDLAREPRGVLLLVTLGVALLSRTLVTLLDLPTLFSFGFFPVLLGLALSVRARESVTGIPFMRLFALFTLVVASSAVVSGTPFVAAVVLWASVSVPFLLLSSIPRSWASRSSRPVRATYVGLLLVQGLLVLGEAILLGKRSDAAQGFLSGQGAGHHVVGFIGAGTALYVGVHLAESGTSAAHGRPMDRRSGRPVNGRYFLGPVKPFCLGNPRPDVRRSTLEIAEAGPRVADSGACLRRCNEFMGIHGASSTVMVRRGIFQGEERDDRGHFGRVPGASRVRAVWHWAGHNGQPGCLAGDGSNLVAALGMSPGPSPASSSE